MDFPKLQIICDNLKLGEMHGYRVTGQLATGETFCLSYLILINGKKSGEGPLTLTIKPTTWNMAWLESDEDGEQNSSKVQQLL